MKKTLLVRNISQLLTMDTGLHDLRSPHDGRILGLVEDAAMVVSGDKVIWVGPSEELPPNYRNNIEVIDAGGRVVMPGLVDCHTHLVFGGSRAHEFGLRTRGATYEEIARQGGGISNTVAETRKSNADELFLSGMARLDAFAAFGITTVEIKSGYGLDFDHELKMLEVIRTLAGRHPLDVVATFLGAHIVPPDYSTKRHAYIEMLCEELIPQVADEQLAEFCDVFCETGAFSVSEARIILEAAGKAGLKLKIHAEQLTRSGGSLLAAELGAVSADHLDCAGEREAVELSHQGVVSVILPGATFFLGKQKYANGRMFIDAGGAVAISTDFNPGSSYTQNLWLMGTMACTNCGLTPAQSLWSMTRGAAKALAREASLGALTPGRQADFLILEHNDWQQILYLYGHNPVAAVYKNGKRL